MIKIIKQSTYVSTSFTMIVNRNQITQTIGRVGQNKVVVFRLTRVFLTKFNRLNCKKEM